MSDLAGLLRARLRGDYEIDPWGYDADLVDLFDPIVGLAWRVHVEGAENVPRSGPAVLVANRRFGVLEPFVVARGVRRATGRPVRFLGVPDVDPVGAALRRLGGALLRPEELASLLRANQVCLLPLGRQLSRWVAGSLAPETLAPAVALGAPVLPVAVVGSPLAGQFRVWVAGPAPSPDSTGPLALAELAEAVHDGIQALLDEAHPPRWPFR